LSLRKKLLLTLAVPGVLLLAVGLAAIFSLNRLARTANTILADNYQTIREARRMQEALLGLGSALSDEAHAQRAEELSQEFEDALLACEDNITEPEEPELIEAIRAQWDGGRENLATDHIAGLSDKVSRLIRVNEKAMYGHRQHTRDVARLLTAVLIVVVGLTVVALIGFSLLAAKRISGPISDAANNLNHILASSRAREDIGASSEGEIERLQAEVKNLLGRISRHEAEQESKLSALRQRLTAVMEEMRDGIVLVDSDLVFQACNRIGNRILGFEGAETHDRTLRQVLEREELRPAFEGFLQTRPAGSQDLAEVKIAAEGGERVYRPHVTPIAGDGSEPDGYLIVFWDATEHFELEESRRRFIAMLSHQLKTPLTSLTMSVNLMAERFSGENEEADELLAVARDDCRSFGELINELIQAAKDVSSGMRLHFHRVDLPRLLRLSLKPLVGQATEKNVEFVDRLGEMRFFAMIDPVKFPWVVTNIVGNALRYTPQGGTVTVELEASDDRSRLVIADTGCGITEKDVKKLFLPYVRLGSDEPTGRHGLGLTIAKEIVEAHNGELSVESRPGEGTRFTITFITEETSQA